MLTALGKPGDLTSDCSDITNATILAMIQTRDVGPFRATGLSPALDDLVAIFASVKANKPDLYAILGTEGMLCCRAVRGSTTNFSNHSWGTAIDMTIGGILTNMNSPTVPQGLVDLYDYFHAQGWFWGAGYQGRTDPMHFEVSNQRILAWKSSGVI